jgi:PleD family two-component response regulator
MFKDTPAPTTKKKVILVVEDSPTQAENIRNVLEMNGLRTVGAIDGLSGLSKALEIIPDLIVMDVHMPGMNGFEVVAALKKEAKTSNIPIVMLTSSDTPESVMMGLEAGAIDYIPKDVFAMSVLVETIKQMGLI